MTERVTDKIKRALDVVLNNSDRVMYVEVRLFRSEYQLVWEALNELKIFDIEYIYTKVMVDDTECRLIIGAGGLK